MQSLVQLKIFQQKYFINPVFSITLLDVKWEDIKISFSIFNNYPHNHRIGLVD
jgi:hypothetical protein